MIARECCNDAEGVQRSSEGQLGQRSERTATWPSLHRCRDCTRSPKRKSAELLCAEQVFDAYYIFPLPTPNCAREAEIARCRDCEQGYHSHDVFLTKECYPSIQHNPPLVKCPIPSPRS